MSTSTPWGASQTATRFAKGINWYTTASHGGAKVCATLNAKIPEYMRADDGWYEEDCDWAIVATVFPEAFTNSEDQWTCERATESLKAAKDTLRNWHPGAYEKFYGVTLVEGESMKRDEEIAQVRHANDLVVVSAFGDWAEGVPVGMVGVVGAVGGDRVVGRRWFLVPSTDYNDNALRCALGFVVDPAKYQEITPLTGASKPKAA